MPRAYVFESDTQRAISNKASGSNLPSPRKGSWKSVGTIDDVAKPGLIGFDAALFEEQGYQVLP